jgi:L,D-peptidoglycan transpeptidase YkuD (ErfK/YbiS/YcfS/YnhG family)
MADHRRNSRRSGMPESHPRGRSTMVGVAAVGVTLVVGTAGALQLTSPSGDQDASQPASAVSSPGLHPTPGPRAANLGEPVRPNRIAGTGSDEGASPAAERAAIPGVGAAMMAKIPQASRQVIVVSAVDRKADTNNVTLWERADPDAAWEPFGAPITGRNGAQGWTTAHVEGDLRTPIGVFSLTAAGGKLPDPGTGLPYEYRPSFYRTGGAGGASMADAFNYVVAIDYNRLPGHPPSDPTRPLGEQAGGDIWLHVDHKSATRACVAVEQDALMSILRWLTPSSQPMIVMGDAGTLAAATEAG